MKRSVTDIAASVRNRLLAMTTPHTNEFQELLVRYARERFLYRLSQSDWRDHFILKGATLLAVWSRIPYRATRDIDLLGLPTPDKSKLKSVFCDLCERSVEPDGLVFHTDSIRIKPIRIQQPYQGIRVTILATLKRTRIHLQIDIGSGDIIVPPAEEIIYPTLLDMPAPRLKAYSRYTVVAEKLSAIVELGLANSRVRDYFDIWVLARDFDFDGGNLRSAVLATFGRRNIKVPDEPPIGLSSVYAEHARGLWSSFIIRTSPIEYPDSLEEVVAEIMSFLAPVISGEADGLAWHPDKGWIARR